MAPSLCEIAADRKVKVEDLIGQTIKLKHKKKSRQPRLVKVIEIGPNEHTVCHDGKFYSTFSNKQDVYE